MIILPASCYNHNVVVTMPAAERAGLDVIRKGNLMKGKMPGKLAALLLTAALCVAGTLLPMNANAATQLTVKDALLIIYSDKSNCGDTAYKSVRSGLKSAASGDILAGRYTKNAVAAFLDHGYFADSYSDFLEKGLLPDGYRLPEKTYQVTRTQDPVNYSRSGDLVRRNVIVTDSLYLQTEQLYQIAVYHGFAQTKEYEKQLSDFDSEYVPKYQWDQKQTEKEESSDAGEDADTSAAKQTEPAVITARPVQEENLLPVIEEEGE